MLVDCAHRCGRGLLLRLTAGVPPQLHASVFSADGEGNVASYIQAHTVRCHLITGVLLYYDRGRVVSDRYGLFLVSGAYAMGRLQLYVSSLWQLIRTPAVVTLGVLNEYRGVKYGTPERSAQVGVL